MAKIDRIKAKISLHEKMFFAALAVVLALLSWILNQPMSSQNWLLLGAGIAFFMVLLFALWHFRKMNKLIEELENA